MGLSRLDRCLAVGRDDATDGQMGLWKSPKCEWKPEPEPFRFFDLPAELRNKIYTYALADAAEPACNLFAYTDPVVAMVSKQMRSESLPIFFAERTFVIVVGANYMDASNWLAAGILLLRPGLQLSLRRAGVAPVIRHVRFKVYFHLFAPTVQRSFKPTSCSSIKQISTLQIDTHPKLICSTEWGPERQMNQRNALTSFNAGLYQARETQFELTTAAAEQKVQELSNKEEFKGFTFCDLDKITKCFRLRLDPVTKRMKCG